MQFVLGIKIICTAHGEKMQDLELNINLRKIIKLNFFEKIIFLKPNGKRGKIESIKEIKRLQY